MIIKYIALLPVLIFYGLGYFNLIWRGDSVHWLYLPLVFLSGGLIVAMLPKVSMEPRTIKNYELLFLLCLQFLVMLCLAFIDFERFRLSRDVLRIRTIWEKMLLVHLFLSWCAAMLLNHQIVSPKPITRRLLTFASWFFIAQSLFIAYLEGRRTAAILPLVFLALFRLSLYRVSFRLISYSTLFTGAFLGLFGLVTSARTGGDFAMKLILDRLFWPAIALNDILTLRPHFDPQTLSQVGSRFLASMGFGQYTSTTNDFGRFMGYLHDRNFVVGINYGVIGEGFLWWGIPGIIIAHIALLLALAFAIRASKNAPFRTTLLLPFLFFHGYQMEIPYTLVAILKGGLILGIISMILDALPRKLQSAP